MTPLTASFTPRSIYSSGGDVMVGRIRLSSDQQTHLLAIWAGERSNAFQAEDETAWRAAADLHGALLRAVLEADNWRRASRGWAA